MHDGAAIGVDVYRAQWRVVSRRDDSANRRVEVVEAGGGIPGRADRELRRWVATATQQTVVSGGGNSRNDGVSAMSCTVIGMDGDDAASCEFNVCCRHARADERAAFGRPPHKGVDEANRSAVDPPEAE